MWFKKKEKAPAPALDPNNIPAHVAIIMDGNGRWAKKRGLPRTAGHSAGSEAFRRAAYYMQDIGVQYLTVYAFSSENWKRPAEEVNAIMGLLEQYLKESIAEMERKNIRLCFFGDLSPLSPKLRQLISETEAISAHTTGLQVNVCLNYGGRGELTRAAAQLAKDCVEGRLQPEEIDEAAVSGYLYSAGMPDPDLMIRPGGEKRLSNFLLWQNAYSEYYFTDTLWPDMDESELEKAIAEYQRRVRRFGGLK